MEKYIIYKSTNIVNGHVYIGFTSKGLQERIRTHKNRCSSNVKCKFYSSVRKYGWNNFIFEELYTSIDGDHCLNTMEPFFIKEYDSYHKGLNDTLGGNGIIGYWTEKNRKKQSDFIKSTWTASRRVKNGLMAKERMTGKPKSEQHKLNLRGKRPHVDQSGSKNNNAKPVSTPYGIFGSIKTAQKWINNMGIDMSYGKICYKLNQIDNYEWTFIGDTV